MSEGSVKGYGYIDEIDFISSPFPPLPEGVNEFTFLSQFFLMKSVQSPCSGRSRGGRGYNGNEVNNFNSIVCVSRTGSMAPSHPVDTAECC
jgi:hypothetical protein